MSSLTSNKVMQVLDSLYDQALEGLPFTDSAEELAKDYLKSDEPLESQIDSLIRWQAAKCGASGFLSGLGGLITLPLAIPANLGSTWYVHLRMLAAIAYMRGWDPKSDQVRTLAYLTLCGDAGVTILKNIGIRIGEKVAEKAIQKISGEALKRINQQIGFRLITKFGEKGIVNLAKAIPLLSGGIGLVVDAYTCNEVGDLGKKYFVLRSNRSSKDGSDLRAA
ncbi:EcsC family protein [bacterium]|nr:EcsC family protein [bacterium]